MNRKFPQKRITRFARVKVPVPMVEIERGEPVATFNAEQKVAKVGEHSHIRQNMKGVRV